MCSAELHAISEAHGRLADAVRPAGGGGEGDAGRLRLLIDQLEEAVAGAPVDALDARRRATVERDLLEAEAWCALAAGDMAKFRATVAALKQRHYLGQSPIECAEQYHLLGLELMALLSVNELGAFRLALERLPYEVRDSNAYVRTPIELEENLAVGYYKRIFLAGANMPSGHYAQFFHKLMATVREEIGRGMAKAYASISCDKARQVLMLDEGGDGEAAMKRFADEHGWRTAAGRFVFAGGDVRAGGEQHGATAVPSLHVDQLAANLVDYADKVDQIV